MIRFMKYFFISFIVTIASCINHDPEKELDLQGHRGCRALLPENTIPAMIKAIDIGMNTLELDVVISKDKKVLLSHEPFMNHQICLSDSIVISEENEMSFNIYEMDYKEVKKFDCGSLRHESFPDQKTMALFKPLLSDVFDTVLSYCTSKEMPIPNFNIEIKSRPEWDLKFHPGIAEYADLLMDVIKINSMEKRVMIQSFDPRTLKYIHAKYPEMSLVYLSENAQNFEGELDALGFSPDIYGPYFITLDKETISDLHRKNIKVIPWTVNEITDIKRLIDWGVDGIISDYPDRLISVAKP
jgi:glycerophosphoryl diester phosphodiesterase